MNPDGVRGNPHDPELFDGVREVDGGLELSFRQGHAVLLLAGPDVVAKDESSAVLRRKQMSLVIRPYGGGDLVHRSWAPGSVAVSWSPSRAIELSPTDGVPVRTVL